MKQGSEHGKRKEALNDKEGGPYKTCKSGGGATKDIDREEENRKKVVFDRGSGQTRRT